MDKMTAPPTLLIAVVDFYSLFPKGKERSVYQKEQNIYEMEKNEEKISSQKKVVADGSIVEQQDVNDTVVQMRSELSQKSADIERLLNENEKLKTELAQAQLLIMEKEETTCVPSEPRATVHLLDSTDNSVHSHITGNGYSLDRVEGVSFSQGDEKMCASALSTKMSGDPLGGGDTVSHLYPSDAFFMRVGRAIDGYLETVTPEKYLDDLCKATHPRKPVLYDELVEEIRKKIKMRITK